MNEKLNFQITEMNSKILTTKYERFHTSKMSAPFSELII